MRGAAGAGDHDSKAALLRRMGIIIEPLGGAMRRHDLGLVRDSQLLESLGGMAEILNCGIAAYDFEDEKKGVCVPELKLWNYGAQLEAEGAPKTSAPDAVAGTR
jgi:hypothetical protein